MICDTCDCSEDTTSKIFLNEEDKEFTNNDQSTNIVEVSCGGRV